MSYYDDLSAARNLVVSVLQERKIQAGQLQFGGEGEKPKRKATVPTDAQSEFLANRAMGDWAERLLASAIRSVRPQWKVSYYGNADKKAAGDPDFKDFYLNGLEEVRKYGKRPDLLLFPGAVPAADDISNLPFAEADSLVHDAIGALEVRSSKFEALKYAEVRAQDKLAGKKSGTNTLGFTVKIEDLKVVYRWIERYGKLQAYVQVFFDSVFAINVLTIFEIVGSGHGFQIKKPPKSQGKATIFVPLSKGVQIGTCQVPKFEAKMRMTRLGRHDAFVVPTEGELVVEADRLEQVLGT